MFVSVRGILYEHASSVSHIFENGQQVKNWPKVLQAMPMITNAQVTTIVHQIFGNTWRCVSSPKKTSSAHLQKYIEGFQKNEPATCSLFEGSQNRRISAYDDPSGGADCSL